MNDQPYNLWGRFQERWLGRRSLIRGAAGLVLGSGLSGSGSVYADNDDGDSEQGERNTPNPFREVSQHSSLSESSYTIIR